ncbi:MAG: hypothetical protein D4R74_14720 [Betaproteobacteria bacterium]|nr:MAG: hypothetical protein D4R74_14720 [Betaproteobacteria bacterium]
MIRHLSNLRVAFGQVFAHPAYIALACVLAIVVFLMVVWFPNFRLIGEVFLDPNAPLAAALGIALSLLGGIGTNFSRLSAGYTIAIAVLFGLVIAMIVYLAKNGRVAVAGRSIAIGSGAMVSSVLGIGCAACGSLLLGLLLPSLGAAGALAALPLQGEEFGILGVGLLFVSLLLVSKNIAQSTACQLAHIGSAGE